jgi:hypothetical protein
MFEIQSFNPLLHDAETKQIRLESFHQDDKGFWYARWRSAAGAGPELKRRQPFTCLHDAYLAVRDAGKPAAPEPQNDLFG